MKKFYFALLFLCVNYACVAQELHQYVDPFIGTGGHGHTYPGATSPFSMVQLSPDTRLDGWDGCSGYHYSDSVVFGFSHTHLQGTGVSDYGDILLMPCTQFAKGADAWKDRYKSKFSKSTEVAHAGYYSVFLEDHGVKVELTTTERVGIHKYTLVEPDTLTLIIDLAHRDELVHYSIYPLDDSTIVGHRLSDNWAEKQYVFFAIRFDKHFDWRDQLSENKIVNVREDGTIEQEMEFVPVFAVDFGVVDELTVRVGLSFTDIKGALANLSSEARHNDFEKYREECESNWDIQLGRILVEGATEDRKTIFYTALYHSCTTPNLASDVDGRYRGTDMRVHQLESGKHYTVFSLWDTFRSLHPLLAWIEPGRTSDFVRSMLRMYEDGGQLPVWELAANYTGCMIGYHSVSVISDAKSWGITGWDEELALEAMLQAADSMHLGLDSYIKKGYIPSEFESEATSKTLEYSFDDACISNYARSLGYMETADRFRLRSLSWRNILHPESHFIQPKRDGAWVPDFDPAEVNFNYTEANGWQYTFFTPHDIQGQIDYAGGPLDFIQMVDDMFNADEETSGRDQADITGLIGQYAHGNEPSHHVAYLPAYVGRQWRTRELVDKIINTLYSSEPDGLCGNEDCGQMSAWYVLSSIGLYPVAPGSGSGSLVVGAPQFDRVTVDPAPSSSRSYQGPLEISVVEGVNGSLRSSVSYDEVLSGGTLVLEISNRDRKGLEIDDTPIELVYDADFLAVPGFTAPRSFQGEFAEVRLASIDRKAKIFYRYGMGYWKRYRRPLKIEGDAELYAVATSRGISSKVVHHSIVKIDHDWKVDYTYPYAHQYSAAGPSTLVDGLLGANDYRTGDWQGFYDTPFEATIDLGEVRSVTGMSLGCMQDVRPWIWLPEYVEFSTSTDGINFTPLERITHSVAEDDYTPQVFRFASSLAFTGRWVKVTAMPRGTIPDWHLGAGGERWTFVDELKINLAE